MSVPVDGFFTQRTPLGDATFVATFRYNERMDRWVLDVADANSVSLIKGQVVQGEWPVLTRFKGIIAGLPVGGLMAVDLTGAHRDPTALTMGGDIPLAYYEP